MFLSRSLHLKIEKKELKMQFKRDLKKTLLLWKQDCQTSLNRANFQCWLVKFSDAVFREALTKWFGIVDNLLFSSAPSQPPQKNTKHFLR